MSAPPRPLVARAELRVAARRHPGRWAAVVIVVLLAVAVAKWAASDPAFRWADFAHYFFDPEVLGGVWNTIRLAVIAWAIALTLGTLLATMRMSGDRVIAGVAWAYSWLFRGVPINVVLLLLLAVASGSFEPVLRIGLPFGGPTLLALDLRDIDLTQDSHVPFLLAVIGFGLCESAYVAELIRAGLISVPAGQLEAAHALGMSPAMTLRRVAIPQALRVALPTLGNEFINLVRLSSLAVVIGYFELMTTVQFIYEMNFLNIPLLMDAAAWYLVLTSALAVGQHFLARHLGRYATV